MTCPTCNKTWTLEKVGQSRIWHWCRGCGTLVPAPLRLYPYRARPRVPYLASESEAKAILQLLSKDVPQGE